MKLKHYLIASEHNDYKPWILTPMALIVFCVMIWGIKVFSLTSITLAASGIDPYDLMNRINLERTQRFITSLNTNSKLSSAASGKAQDMLNRSYFAHVDPDGNYVWPRIEKAGYSPYLTLGENLAMDFSEAPSVVNAWMNSPTHRQNIVNTKFEDQGLAAVSGNYAPNHDTIMIVSLFGTLYKNNPPPPQPSPSPTPSPQPTPIPTPTPTPAPVPVIQNPPASTSKLKISDDIKVSTTSLSGKILVNVDAIIAGSPTLVTASLKQQSISLIASSTTGQYLGSFTFDATENLAGQTLNLEARDKNGVKATLQYAVNIESPSPVGAEPSTIPISNEARVMSVLRIVFGVFAAIYMGFLAIDAIIIHRQKIKREGVHSLPHVLVFALVAIVTLFSNWG